MLKKDSGSAGFHVIPALVVLTLLVHRPHADPVRVPGLDGLASDIAAAGFVPGGGDLLLLAAASGWLTPVDDVTIHQGPVDPGTLVRELAGDGPVPGCYGFASDGETGLSVMVTAPDVRALPVGIPAGCSPGDTVRFSVEGMDSLPEPGLAVCTPDLGVLDLSADSSGTFSLPVSARGVYWLELIARPRSGPEVVLLFPLVSGGSIAEVLRGDIPYQMSGAVSAEEVLAELDAIREARGVPPLEREASLDSIAWLRAAELALSGSTSHYSTDGSSIADLLDGGTSFAENIGRGSGFDEAWSMLLISPHHLRTCLSSDYSSTGLAGAVDAGVERWQLVLVQVFTSRGGNR